MLKASVVLETTANFLMRRERNMARGGKRGGLFNIQVGDALDLKDEYKLIIMSIFDNQGLDK